MNRPRWETAAILVATILAGGGQALLKDSTIVLAPLVKALIEYTSGAGVAVILYLMRPQGSGQNGAAGGNGQQ